MNSVPHGELVPEGGGSSIPLVRDQMRVGRRQSCDIWLNYDNVSGYHCELAFLNGIWHLTDLGSTNGTRVNGSRIQKRKLKPGDKVTFGKRHYRIEYNLPDDIDLDVLEEVEEDVMSKPLLERAGLVHKKSRVNDEEEYRRRLMRQLMDDDDDDDDDD